MAEMAFPMQFLAISSSVEGGDHGGAPGLVAITADCSSSGVEPGQAVELCQGLLAHR